MLAGPMGRHDNDRSCSLVTTGVSLDCPAWGDLAGGAAGVAANAAVDAPHVSSNPRPTTYECAVICRAVIRKGGRSPRGIVEPSFPHQTGSVNCSRRPSLGRKDALRRGCPNGAPAAAFLALPCSFPVAGSSAAPATSRTGACVFVPTRGGWHEGPHPPRLAPRSRRDLHARHPRDARRLEHGAEEPFVARRPCQRPRGRPS